MGVFSLTAVRSSKPILQFKMNSLARSTFMARRLLSTTAVQSERQVHPVFKKLKATQQMYQADNGLVIYLRAGARDKALFYFTTGLLFTVCGLSASSWYEMAMKGR